MQYVKMLVHIINNKNNYSEIYKKLGTAFKGKIINSVVDVNQPGNKSKLNKVKWLQFS